MLFNLYFGIKPNNLHLKKTKKPMKISKNLTMPTIIVT